jgi:hypothetical protein
MEAQIELLRAQAGELKDAIKKTDDDQKEASMVALQSKMDTIMAKVDRDMQPPADDIQTMAVKLVQAINSNAAGKLDERLVAIEAALSEIKDRIITVANNGDNSTLGRLDLKQTSGAQRATPSEPTGPGSKRKRVEDDVDVISLSYLEELTAERWGKFHWFRYGQSLGSTVFERLVPCQDIPDWNPKRILESPTGYSRSTHVESQSWPSSWTNHSANSGIAFALSPPLGWGAITAHASGAMTLGSVSRSHPWIQMAFRKSTESACFSLPRRILPPRPRSILPKSRTRIPFSREPVS